MKKQLLMAMAVVLALTTFGQQNSLRVNVASEHTLTTEVSNSGPGQRPDDIGAKVPTIIWSEDFGNGWPTGWQREDLSPGAIAPWVWSMDGSWGQYNGNGGATVADVTIESTTAANGFLISDTDSSNWVNYGSGANYVPLETYVITSAIDVSGYPNVILEFQQYFSVLFHGGQADLIEVGIGGGN